VVTFDTEDFDSFGTTLSSGVFTVPSAQNGFYLVLANVNFDTNNTGTRSIQIRKNGTGVSGNGSRVSAGTENGGVHAVLMTYLAVGDTIDVRVRQSSGGNLNARGGENESYIALIQLSGRRWYEGFLAANKAYSSNAITANPMSADKYNPSGHFVGAGEGFASNQNATGVMPPDGYVLAVAKQYFSSTAAGAAAGFGSGVSGSAPYSKKGRYVLAAENEIEEAYSMLGLANMIGGITASSQGVGKSAIEDWSASAAIGGSPTLTGGADKCTLSLYALNRLRLYCGWVPGTQTYTSGTTPTVHSTDGSLASGGVGLHGSHAPFDTFTLSSGLITVPRTGDYLIFIQQLSAWNSSATGRRYQAIDKNSGTNLALQVRDGMVNAGGQFDALAWCGKLTSGDTIRMLFYSNSGADTILQPELFILYLGNI